MNSQTKTRVFRLLARLPRSWGDAVYHLLQVVRGQETIEGDIRSKEVSFAKISKVLAGLRRSLDGRRVLEIGSGWLPTMPYLLKYVGKCRSVYSYDINRHYSRARNRAFNQTFFSMYHQPDMPAFSNQNYCLPADIHYFPHTNLADSISLDYPMDLAVSRFVLEHIPPDEMLRLHQTLKNLLGQDGVIIHLVSPSDHRAYQDKALSLYEFLQYSQAEWDAIQTRFDYHNRLRLPQYVELFEQAGLEVVHSEWTGAPAQDPVHERVKNNAFRVHSDFAHYSFEQLTAGSLVFALRRTMQQV